MRTILTSFLLLIIMTAAPAWADAEKCPDQVLHKNLAVEGILKERGPAGGFYVNIDLAPRATIGQAVLTLSVPEPAAAKALMAMEPGARIRATYDMIQKYSSLDNECFVYGVLRTVKELK